MAAPKRYTEEQKRMKLHGYHGERKRGHTALEAAKLVGVHYITLLKWEKDANQDEAQEASSADSPDLRIVMPNGIMVYGSPRDLAQVLKGVENNAS